MLRSDFLVSVKEGHTDRHGCPMLRKELTPMIVLFRQVQTVTGFKLVGTTFIYIL